MKRRTPVSACASSQSPAWDRPITDNERAWIEIIRLASWDTDPPPTLATVQRVRKAFGREFPSAEDDDTRERAPKL